MGLFNRKKRDEGQVVDPEERSPELGLKHKDLALLGQMLQQGAKLQNPRHVLHFLYFGEEMQARAASDETRQGGWESEVREPLPEYPDQWSLVCEQQAAVLTPEFVRDSTDFFEAVAGRHQGDYDGREAALD